MSYYCSSPVLAKPQIFNSPTHQAPNCCGYCFTTAGLVIDPSAPSLYPTFHRYFKKIAKYTLMPIRLSLIDFVQQRLPEETGDATSPSEIQGEEVADPIGFETDVSRATFSALIMRPIYELESRRFGQSDASESQVWDSVDLMWTAFAILDVISELTEYQVGATRTEVVGRIVHLIRKQVEACKKAFSDEVLEDVVRKVFDHLVNRNNRYLPFSYTYFNGVSESFKSRRFWIIKTVFTGEGQEARFSLTAEGYAAYFGLHESSALDATAIGNLRIKLLLDRGNLDDAINVADGNRKQCARKAHEVRTVRRLIKRNIQTVAYDRVEGLADEGVNQAMDIQKEGSRLHNLVIENMLGSETGRSAFKLHRLAEKLEALNHSLMKLAGELQDLPEDYQSNSHKLFRRRGTGAFPCMDEVLQRIFRLDENHAALIGTEFIARIDPPARRTLFDPAAVIEACDRALEKQQMAGDHSQAMIEVDGKPILRFQPDLSDQLMLEAFEMLQGEVVREKEVLVSTLLKKAAQSTTSDLFAVAVAMGIFQNLVDPRLAQKHNLSISLLDPDSRIAVDLGGGRLYRGHELRVKYSPISLL